LIGRYLLLALKRPDLIPALAGAAWAFRARDWYRRPPFLPLPPRSYMDWRNETAYGDPGHRPPERELIRYLRWARDMRKRM
jgi:hypothetical protein